MPINLLSKHGGLIYTCPKDDYKVEPPEVFIDRKGFDPSDPVGYLNSFEIRANRPTAIYLS